MNNCLEATDLQAISDSMVADFKQRIASIPADLCAPFHAEAQKLETQLLMVYKMIAMVTRKQEDLIQVSKLWACVVSMCDASAKQLGELVKQHPNCGADYYYDRVLDLRNKCLRLEQLHS